MRHSLFLLALIFVFCKNENPQSQLFVIADQVAVRDAPGEKSRELRVLHLSEQVTDLGEVSSFETQVRIGETLQQAPWIKVQTAGKQVGWMFAASVAAGLKPAATEREAWLREKKMTCYFGKNLTSRFHRFLAADGPASDADFAARYREAVALRDTFMHLLASRAEPNEADFKPDFSWLAGALPGFVFQKIAEGTQPYLFADYQFWQKKALQTSGTQDDAFLETCLTAFPADSIESFFPAWTFQITDYEAASQLGSGIHLKMLQQIEKAMQAGPLFQPELTERKEALLEDVLSKNTTYWQPKELIVKELGQILAAHFSCLNDRDLVALETRLKMLQDPEANGVRVNLRAG